MEAKVEVPAVVFAEEGPQGVQTELAADVEQFIGALGIRGLCSTAGRLDQMEA